MTNPKNATTTSRGRTYRWRDEQFDSVTTILSGGIPKPALKPWGEKLVATTAVQKKAIWTQMDEDAAIDWLKRAPFRETDKAAVQGSDIHAWAEAYVLGKPVPEPPATQQPYCRAFIQFIRDFRPRYEMTEATVYNRTHGYAGTCDFIAEFDDLGLVLGDYKTGKGVYGEVALQLAAYRHAEFVGIAQTGEEHPLPKVDACAVLHLTADGYELIPVEAGEEELQFFLHAQQVRHFTEQRSKEVLGSPLRVPQPAPRPVAPPNVAALVD